MKMNSGYVGAQLEILPTNIKQEVGCLGPHEKILEVGDENNMLYQEGGNVPIWMTPQERVATKFSQCDELQLKNNTKAQLLGNIKSSGVDISVVKEKRVGDLQDIPCKILISVKNIIRKERVKVQMGNPNGLLWVLWEHVFMDTSKDVCTY